MPGRYAVVTIEQGLTKKEALARNGHHSQIVKVAGYNEPCPKGADHAHASYDGATWCRYCEQFLSLRIEKKE